MIILQCYVGCIYRPLCPVGCHCSLYQSPFFSVYLQATAPIPRQWRHLLGTNCQSVVRPELVESVQHLLSPNTAISWQKLAKTFSDCAVFFAISIQISCVVVLVRRGFSISANGLGGLTVQITRAVALLCMLPLIFPMFILRYTTKREATIDYSCSAAAGSCYFPPLFLR